MSTKYDTKAPGVYGEYIVGGSRPIQAVGTSVAGFVGDIDSKSGSARPSNDKQYDVVQVTNWPEFVKLFVTDTTVTTALTQAVWGFFNNGGSLCYVVDLAGGPLSAGLAALATIDNIAIVVAPGRASASDYQDVISHCERLGTCHGILDAPLGIVPASQFNNLTKVISAEAPAPAAAPGGAADPAPAAPPAPNPKSGLLSPQSDKVAYYYPYIREKDALNPNNPKLIDVAPSGHIAGIWARSDGTRGVHKAPANEPVRGAVDVTHRLTKEQHGQLNALGVNVIRFYSETGVTVMGARTRDGAASEFRYLNVRRLVTMIQASLEPGLRPYVFESNDRPLWNRLIRDVSAFLIRVWRDGALQGDDASQAFFVKCDEETNPQENIDAGIVTIMIGIAPVKPAEFVVFQIRQGVGDPANVSGR